MPDGSTSLSQRLSAFILRSLRKGWDVWSQLPEAFRAALGDPPSPPSKLDGGGIFLFRQNPEDVAEAPDRIMHDLQSETNENTGLTVNFPERVFRDSVACALLLSGALDIVAEV